MEKTVTILSLASILSTAHAHIAERQYMRIIKLALLFQILSSLALAGEISSGSCDKLEIGSGDHVQLVGAQADNNELSLNYKQLDINRNLDLKVSKEVILRSLGVAPGQALLALLTNGARIELTCVDDKIVGIAVGARRLAAKISSSNCGSFELGSGDRAKLTSIDLTSSSMELSYVQEDLKRDMQLSIGNDVLKKSLGLLPVQAVAAMSSIGSKIIISCSHGKVTSISIGCDTQ